MASPDFVFSTCEEEAVFGWRLSSSTSCPKGNRVGMYLLLSFSWRVWGKISSQLLYLPKFNSDISICPQCLHWQLRWDSPDSHVGWPRVERGVQTPQSHVGSVLGWPGVCGLWQGGRWPQAAQGLNVLEVSGSQQPPSAALSRWTGSANGRSVLGWLTPRVVGYLIGYLMFPCWNQAHAHQPWSHPRCLMASSTAELLCNHRHKHRWGWPL